MDELIKKELLARGICEKFHMVRYSRETVDTMLEMAQDLGVRDSIEWGVKEIGYCSYLTMRLKKD